MGNSKIMKSSLGAKAGIAVGEEVARMAGNEDHWIQTDATGTFINGPLSLPAPQEIRMGGLWKMGDAFKLMIPSTLATPTPILEVDPPLKGLQNIMKGAVEMMALFGMFSSIK
jgi:hypothetical protein